MGSNIDTYKSDFQALVKTGEKMRSDLACRELVLRGQLASKDEELAEKLRGTFETEYQRWFTESSAVLRQLLPDRATEFSQLYMGDGKRKKIDAFTYNIQDWLNGVRASSDTYTEVKDFDDFGTIAMRFSTQQKILETVAARFESSLLDIRQLVQADLFDSELDASRELLKKGFKRGAGAIAGVVLEKHLKQVLANHKITTRKKNPQISDLNDVLKNEDVLDVPRWRQIQRLGDIRNLCDHDKDRDPTDDEVSELIDGVDKITKTLF